MVEVIPKAVAYARSLLAAPQDAEDVVHDVLCRLLNHPEYDLPADGQRLLFRSVTNACINRWQRRKVILSLDGRQEDRSSLGQMLESSKATDPVETVMRREEMEQVGEALKQLPPMQRAAVELKALGHSLKEIAAHLNVSASNAGVLIHRGRKALSERLAVTDSSEGVTI